MLRGLGGALPAVEADLVVRDPDENGGRANDRRPEPLGREGRKLKLTTENAVTTAMYEAVTVRFPTDSSPPGPTVLEGAAASLSVIVTLFSEVGPVERTPDPSRENQRL